MYDKVYTNIKAINGPFKNPLYDIKRYIILCTNLESRSSGGSLSASGAGLSLQKAKEI